MLRYVTPEATRGFILGAVVITAAVFGGHALEAPHTLAPEPLTTPEQIAAAFDVNLVRDITACGEVPSYMRFNGCATASTIYLAPDLDATGQHQTMLHELGHVIQSRLGVDRDECKADQFALLYGAPGIGGVGCKP